MTSTTIASIDIIRQLADSGATGIAEIATEPTKRGIEPPTSDGWTARDVSRLYTADASHRGGR